MVSPEGYAMKRLIVLSIAALIVTGLSATATAGTHQERTCHGHHITLRDKHPHKALLNGTRHADVIWGGRGRDVIQGRGGKDIICGGPGADILDGNKKLDTIYGGAGRDLCFGVHREHMRLHHGCEVHLRHPPAHHPKTGKTAVPTFGSRADVRRLKDLAQAGDLPLYLCGGTCDAGTPGCNSGDIGSGVAQDYVYWNEPNNVYPLWAGSGNGTVAMNIWWVRSQADGGLALDTETNWMFYDVTNSPTHLIPSPLVMPLNHGGLGVVMVEFSYAPPGGTYTAIEWDVPDNYFSLGGILTGTTTGNICMTANSEQFGPI
jgi:RTX calcium-binding nonapeptide repeat (4 copies)